MIKEKRRVSYKKRGAEESKKQKETASTTQATIQMLEHKQSHMNLLGKRFRIEDEMLGFGSFGRTYLGKDIRKNKHVAIKIVRS